MKRSKSDAVVAKQTLRDAGLRATAARMAVVRLLSSEVGPKSHAEIVEALDDFGFDQSTLTANQNFRDGTQLCSKRSARWSDVHREIVHAS